jgi:diguanylate cyclase (GGDEF)-like protein
MASAGRPDPHEGKSPTPVAAQEIFGALIEAAPDAMLVVDEDGEIVFVSNRAESLFGYSRQELLGESFELLVIDSEFGRRKDGSTFPVETSFSSVSTSGRTFVASVIRDATERRTVERRLRFLAEHDALTGLGNRREFEERVTEQLARAKRYGEQAALLMIDVDDFKRINDTYGHHAGDEGLRAIGGVLSESVRVMDSVARIGGDEFAVLLPYADRGTAEEVADKLRHAVARRTLSLGDHEEVPLSISIGIAMIDKTTSDEEAAFRAADLAMFEQKHHGGAGLTGMFP